MQARGTLSLALRGALAVAGAALVATTAAPAGAQSLDLAALGAGSGGGGSVADLRDGLAANGSLSGPLGGSLAEALGGPAYHFAVFGDVPYGAAQEKLFPGWIDDINADAPQFTVHVGDTKNGKTQCTDEHATMIKTQFDRFTNPLVYTPGDNEWTDCHRANNGAFDPLERLAALRKLYFPAPGTTFGKPMAVQSPTPEVPENLVWRKPGLSFAALHIVGSNNGLLPWDGRGETVPNAAQIADEKQRMDSAVATMKNAFADARRTGAEAVVLFQQADMFVPGETPDEKNFSAFTPFVRALAEQAKAWGGPVYLFDGDTHEYHVDKPLADSTTWSSFYGVDAVPNLTRVTVDGEENNKDFLEVTRNLSGSPEVLTWKRVPYSVVEG